MASKPRLHYFNFRGRVEYVRLAMAAGGMDFEDCRFKPEEWPSIKPKAPFGQAPFLELNGKVYAQTIAIAKWVARETGLYGQNSLEQLEVDQVLHLVQDLLAIVTTFYMEKDKDKFAAAAKKFKEEDSPRYFGYLEKIIKDNGTGYAAGGSLTLADIVIYELITSGAENALMKDNLPNIDDYPCMKNLVEKVSCNKGIRQYEAKREQTTQ